MERFDLQYNDAGLVVDNNDVVWGLSDTQHVEDTINASPGWWKENFADGVGIRNYLNSSGQEQVLTRNIKLQLESDLYTVVNPQVSFDSAGKLIVQPNATI